MADMPLRKDYAQRSLEVMPTAPKHYTNKAYVDAIMWEAVAAAAPVNVALTGVPGGYTLTGPIDGVALADGMRIALFGQSTASENGVYRVITASPVLLEKTTDFDPPNALYLKQLRVLGGDTHGDAVLVNTAPSGDPVQLQRDAGGPPGSEVILVYGDGVKTIFTVVHTLGTRNLVVSTYQASSGQRYNDHVRIVGTDRVEIDFDAYVPAPGEEIRVILVKASDDSRQGTMAPSQRRDDIPLVDGVLHTSYTLPADGYVVIRGLAVSAGTPAELVIQNTTTGMVLDNVDPAPVASRTISLAMPGSRGDRLTITRRNLNTASPGTARFIYSKSTIEQMVTPVPGMTVKTFTTDGVKTDFAVAHNYRSKNVMVEVHDANDTVAHFTRSFPDENTVVLSGTGGDPLPAGIQFTVLITGVSGGGMVPSTKTDVLPINYTANTAVNFTATGNGYLKYSKGATAVNEFVDIRDADTNLLWTAQVPAAGRSLVVDVPCRKGQRFTIRPSAAGTHNTNVWTHFIYAKDSDGPPAALDYSNTEQFTGKRWLDGKKVYQRYINCGALPNATDKIIANALSGVRTIISLAGIAHATDGYVIPLPHPGITAAESVELAAYRNNLDIRISTAADKSKYTSAYVMVEYTKTTD